MKKVLLTTVAAMAFAFCMTACCNNSKPAEAEEPCCDTTAVVCDTTAHECMADIMNCCEAKQEGCMKAEGKECCKKAEGKECCKKAEGQKCEGKCEKAK